MGKPLVAIVGRPNVGKSTFFNRIAGKRISIVEDVPGVTRDRLYYDVEWTGRVFTLVDTGGIDPLSDEQLPVSIKQQAEIAIDASDVIIFMVDGREGLTGADQHVADLLRKSEKPIILVCNKIDAAKYEENIYEFYALGLGQPMSISAEQGLGLGDLLDRIVSKLPGEDQPEEDDDIIKIAVVGKPNAGKSSIVNSILGEERTIVSDIPGTTRDAIDTPFEKDGRRYLIIDTAGVRRKSRIKENVERYSVLRAFTAVRRADVCLLVIDALEGVSEQDGRLAGYIHEEGKGLIIVVNKWDLLEKNTRTMDNYRRRIYNQLPFVSYAPILFVSAKTGQRIFRITELVGFVSEQSSFRISTGVLNEVINEATASTQPPSDKGKNLKLYYATQVSIKPPTFVLFVNDTRLMHFSYKRYIENYLRKTFGLEGTPIRIIARNRSK
ncbi:MAG: ribosome biogenesis GTPase Der [Mahellales bacterium]